MSEFPNIEKLREAVSSEGRVVDQLCDSFSNHTWVRLNLVNPIRRAFGPARFLLSLLDEGGRLVVEAPCGHGEHAVEPMRPGRDGSGSAARGVVGCLGGHDDVVRMRLLESGRGGPHEPALLLEIGDRSGAGVEHRLP